MGKFVIEPRVRDYRETWQILMAPHFGNPILRNNEVAPRAFDRRDEIMSRHSYDFTRNEVRREAGFDPVADGDVYLVPTNLAPETAKRAFIDKSRAVPAVKLI